MPVMELLAEPGTALALLFAIGGSQGVLILVLPHWTIDSPAIVLAVALASLVSAPVVYLSRHRLNARSRRVVLGGATVATSVAVLGCGSQQSTISASYFYFLVTLYAAAYFRPRAAVVHMTLIGGVYAFVLALHPAPAFPAQWLQAMMMLTVTAVIVGGFAVRVRHAAAAMTFQALHDPLTGLANRALFLDRLDRALGEAERSSNPVGVLFMDLDDFKEVNDSLGHPIGDELLIAVAERLSAVTRAGDTLARLGGDDFALLVESGPVPATTADLASRLAGSLELPFLLDGAELSMTMSVGIATSHHGRETSAQLLGDADLAMYRAKRNGKARFETVLPGMQDAALEHLSLVTDLRRALERGQLEVFYQPIVAVSSGRPVGAEALLRWRHPSHGFVAPADFIGVAESAGLIVSIGNWVLNQAVRQATAWNRAGMTDDAFYISVNLSPRQLAEPSLVEDVSRALHDSRLRPGSLVLEITESALMSDFDLALPRLEALKDLGVRLALDDYGTGYSSLSRLRQLPIDIIKIDKSFVDVVTQGTADRALVRSIIDVARALGIVTIAEGVELAAQYVTLEDLGCDSIQGFLLAKPASGIETGLRLQRLAAADPGRFAAPPEPAFARRPSDRSVDVPGLTVGDGS